MPAILNQPWTLLADKTEDFAWFPEAASTFAAENDWLYGVITIVCVIFFIPIASALFYFAIRYRKPKGVKAESNTAHNTPLELAWSIGPSFFLVGMFILGAKAYLNHRTVPDGARDIKVLSSSWNWSFDYGGGTVHPELHIVVEEPTKLSMRSSDVIHSLFVPAFRAKKDIVPGRYNYMWFEATVASRKVSDEELAAAKKKMKDLGEENWNFDELDFTPDGYTYYDLYCTEYCGLNHSQMQTVVVVHETQEDFDAWIKKYSKRGEGEELSDYGRKLYSRRGCSGCHSLDGSKRVGPSFQEVFGNKRPLANGDVVVADENYIRESILYPKAKVSAGYQPVMPSYKGQLTEDDIDSLVEFLKEVSEYTPTAIATDDSESIDGEKAANLDDAVDTEAK
ncbi:MAG: cytochrome c oxidase subunit II [Planctomycetota bacterium]|nr:cytochrome c oxidase subunit II [Planctomycetota bacterium]